MWILILAIAVVAVSGQDDFGLDPSTLTTGDVNLADSANVKKCLPIADPNDTALCYPFPPWMQPDPNIWDIQGVTIHTVWWWWVRALRKTKKLAASGDSKTIKCMREIPKRFIKAVDDNDLEKRLSDQARTLKIKGQWHP